MVDGISYAVEPLPDPFRDLAKGAILLAECAIDAASGTAA
jgi:hypothetical protein